MRKWFPLALLLLPFGQASAQTELPKIPHCGFEIVWKNLEQSNPGFRAQYDARMSAHQNGAARPTGTVYDIPVVFHVVYYQNGTTVKGNLPDSVILNQLKVLNGAYRKNHADTGNLRAIFKPIAADAEIQFHLATTDPNGNPTTGITRTATNIANFGDMSIMSGDLSSIERIKHTAQGGKDAWNTTRYLNIWIADMSISIGGSTMPAILGIARPPLNPLPPNWGSSGAGLEALVDGVTIQYQCVGNNNPYIGELSALGVGTAGRTAVHEVGHYLGLRHIWGDPETPADACTASADDGVGDTPAQAKESDMSASPTPSVSQNTCFAGTTGDLPDLWENYMDYSKDNAQNMFTQGQVALIRGVCGDQRDSLFLGTPPPTAINPLAAKDRSLVIYPQPASQHLSFDFNGKVDQVKLINILGQTVIDVAGQKAAFRKIAVDHLAPGNYYLQVVSEGRSYNRQVAITR